MLETAVMRKDMRLFVLCFLLIVLLAAGQLQAAIIFNTFGDGDSYNDTGGGYSIGDSDDYDIANKFFSPQELHSNSIRLNWQWVYTQEQVR